MRRLGELMEKYSSSKTRKEKFLDAWYIFTYYTYGTDLPDIGRGHIEKIVLTSGQIYQTHKTDLTDILDRFTRNIENIYQTYRTDQT